MTDSGAKSTTHVGSLLTQHRRADDGDQNKRRLRVLGAKKMYLQLNLELPTAQRPTHKVAGIPTIPSIPHFPDSHMQRQE